MVMKGYTHYPTQKYKNINSKKVANSTKGNSSDWHGLAKPTGFLGKGLSGKGKRVYSVT
jgi:hypothetical protein